MCDTARTHLHGNQGEHGALEAGRPLRVVAAGRRLHRLDGAREALGAHGHQLVAWGGGKGAW